MPCSLMGMPARPWEGLVPGTANTAWCLCQPPRGRADRCPQSDMVSDWSVTLHLPTKNFSAQNNLFCFNHRLNCNRCCGVCSIIRAIRYQMNAAFRRQVNMPCSLSYRNGSFHETYWTSSHEGISGLFIQYDAPVQVLFLSSLIQHIQISITK